MLGEARQLVKNIAERWRSWNRSTQSPSRPVQTTTQPQIVRGRVGSTKFALLTITDAEFDAAQNIMGLRQQIAGLPYYVETASENHGYNVVLRQAADRTNHPASKAVGRFIEDFRPEYILLIGTAGGVQNNDVAIGDVFVPNYVEYCEFMKLTGGRNLTRKIPFDHPSLGLLENFARPLRTRKDWVDLLPAMRPPALGDREIKAVIGGSIISSDKIWGDPTSEQQRFMLSTYDKAVAFETEAVGVATAVYEQRRFVHYNPQYLVIRGISDIVDEPNADEIRRDCTPFAASAAAAFACYLVQDVLNSPLWE